MPVKGLASWSLLDNRMNFVRRDVAVGAARRINASSTDRQNHWHQRDPEVLVFQRELAGLLQGAMRKSSKYLEMPVVDQHELA